MWQALFHEAFATFGISGLVIALGCIGTTAAFIKFLRVVAEFGAQSGKMAAALDSVGHVMEEHDKENSRVAQVMEHVVDASRTLALEVRSLAEAQRTAHLQQMGDLVGLTRDLAERVRGQQGGATRESAHG